MALIEVQGLTKLYRMGETVVHALDGVDLQIEQGEFAAITGPSGSGKSTIMHVLGCLDRPTAGTYRLNGRELSEMSDRELAAVRNKYIGFVFQTFNLLNRTPALDNVGVPLFYGRIRNYRDPARQALERVGLGHRVDHRPSELSGGERQRVAIARAMVNNPVLLLADEPTGNLDSRTGAAIMEIFHRLNEEGVTVVLVTHESDVARQARRIVQMRDGRVVADRPNTPQEPPAERTAAMGDEQVAGHGLPADAALEPTAQPTPVAAAEWSNGPQATTGISIASLPRRRASGATASLTCGLVSAFMLAASVVSFLSIYATGWRPDPVNPTEPPPHYVLALVGAGTLALLVGVVAGFIAIFWARGVLRRIRNEPGNWDGAGRARTGFVFGLLTVLAPLLWIGVQFTRAIIR